MFQVQTIWASLAAAHIQTLITSMSEEEKKALEEEGEKHGLGF
jgi:hypothetical protein